MRWSVLCGIAGLAGLASVASAQARPADRMNPMIALMEKKLPVLGIQNPPYSAGRGGGGRRGAGAADAAAVTTPPPPPPPFDMAAAAKATVDYKLGDFVLNTFSNGTIEAYREFMKAIVAAGGSAKTHPFIAKIPRMAPGRTEATQQQIIVQANEGQVSFEMQQVETTEEIDQVVAALRFKSKGGVRPDTGIERAAAYWAMTPAQYLQKADVWPLNPNGELMIGIIIESREGVANAKKLAAHPGVAVVTMGAGTWGGVAGRGSAEFSAGTAAVLAACKEARKSCGYPANNPTEVETLMKAGWDFLIMQRRDSLAFAAVIKGRELSGRPIK
jgi:4-hydroxy-2-oxoheptanedioate aldolase